MVIHKTMSLFSAPNDSIIVHACNSQGVWGSGIAKAFKEKYAHSYVDYNRFCADMNMSRGSACGRAGMSSFHVSEDHWVAWIVTSHNFGSQVSVPELIKIHTTMALQDLCKKIYLAHSAENHPTINVYSNKFNSGLFNVPWADSELILETVLKDFQRINWFVCSEV